jgi:hypothetical protein
LQRLPGGLDPEEVAFRLKEYGRNTLPSIEKHRGIAEIVNPSV